MPCRILQTNRPPPPITDRLTLWRIAANVPSMWHRIARGLLLALMVLAVSAAAQAQVPSPAVSAEELEKLVTTLEDDAARKQLVAQLRSLIEAQRAAQPQLPDRVAARFLGTLSDRLAELGGAIFAAAGFLADAPRLVGWMGGELGDEATRARLIEIISKVGLVVLAGALAAWAAKRILFKWRSAVERREVAQDWRRVPQLLLLTAIRAVPVAVFAAVAHVALPLIDRHRIAYLAAVAIIEAVVLSRGVALAAGAVLTPGSAALRLVDLQDETATYLYIWIRRIAGLAIYGYLAAIVGVIVGMPPDGYAFAVKFLSVGIVLLLIVLIFQNRTAVAEAIVAPAEAGEQPSLLQRRVAPYWHVLATLYLVVTCLIWLLRPEPAIGFALRATLVTLGILFVARLAARLMRHLVAQALSISDEFRGRYPGLEARANRYLQIVPLVLSPVIYGFAILAVFQAWGLGSLEWFATPLGRRISTSAVSIAVVGIVTLALWEAANVLFERIVGEPSPGDVEAARRSARLRTLWPFVRRAILAVLAVIVILIVLSELGINIAPLLAGAGVVGIAVGIGAQNLVKDLVGGMGLVLDDALAVGDVVTIGDKSGVVEAMTLRSVRLRSFDGTAHTIPFSAVSVVSNQTKEFGFAVFEIGIGYGEDVDRVSAIMAAVGAELRQDDAFAALIIGELEILGLDKFTDSAVIIKARLRTLPGHQWAVMRAFNRRLKFAFDREGIEIPFPQRTVHVVAAPAARSALTPGAAAAES